MYNNEYERQFSKMKEEDKNLVARYGSDTAELFNRAAKEKREQESAAEGARLKQEREFKQLEDNKSQCNELIVSACRKLSIHSGDKKRAYQMIIKMVQDYFHPEMDTDKSMSDLYAELERDARSKEWDAEARFKKLTK